MAIKKSAAKKKSVSKKKVAVKKTAVKKSVVKKSAVKKAVTKKAAAKAKTTAIQSKMTKSQMLAAMSEKTEMSKKEVEEFIDKFVALALDEVKGSGEFVIPGIGKLVKVHRKARMGRNPATGETIQIAAKTVVKFRVAKAAKESLL